MRKGFTLIELLIVVAIIAILAAIAVPNFLEAQTRAKVSRAKSDMRSITTAIETYRVDHNKYPEGTDNPANYPQPIVDYLNGQPTPLAAGYYSFRTRGPGGLAVGRDFAGITSPIAYISTVPTDVFAGHAASFLTYCFRNAKDTNNGWVLTSVGPDTDLLAAGGKGTNNTGNPISTAASTASPARLADIDERSVIHVIEGTSGFAPLQPALRTLLEDLTYDPSNGTISDGDLVRVGP